MGERKCNFVCYYLDASGKCGEIGGDCIRCMCENWMDCDLCRTDRDECRE